jgi:orotate phosphoribosyltransferase
MSRRPLAEILRELEPILVARSFQYGDFTLSSGARSRYFFDSKLTMLSPEGARLVGEALYSVLSRCDVEAAGGLAMGAAYMASLIAQASVDGETLIYGYTVRRDKKDHGRGQKIDESWHPDGEPLIRPGRRVALVDDVITTGGSTIEALEEVKAAGCDVRAVAAIVDRGAGGAERFAELGVPFYSLFVADEDGKLGPGRRPV